MSVHPVIKYNDAPAAIEWLKDALGFEEKLVVPDESGEIMHAELTIGDGVIMTGSFGAGDPRFEQPAGAAVVYVAIDDVDSHHERAAAAGAEILMPPTDQDYGSRDYAVKDPEGNIWSFGTYRP